MKNLRGLKIFSSEKNKGCETVGGAKFSNTRENKGYEIFHGRKRLLGMSGRNSAYPNKLLLCAVNRGFSSVGAILETGLSVKNKGMSIFRWI